MKCRSFGFLFAVMTAVLALFSGISVNAYTKADDFSDIASQTVKYKMNQCGYGDVQEFINGWITKNAGVNEADWYALALSKTGSYDFSSYRNALESAAGSSALNATEKLRAAVVYNAVGGENLNLAAVTDNSWNGLGIMSELYALILYNYGDFTAAVTEDEIISSILAGQLPDGGWALSGNRSDTDVTAIAVQALAPYRDRADTAASIEKALGRLSQLQQADGGFGSYGTQNAESCAQVIIALKCLDIDPCTDVQFLKNGLSAVDALLSYRCASGGFSHTRGGSENYLASVQACLAMTALEYDDTDFFGPCVKNEIPAATTAVTNTQTVNKTTAAAENNKPGSVTVTEATESVASEASVQTTETAISGTVAFNASGTALPAFTAADSDKSSGTAAVSDKDDGGAADNGDEKSGGWKLYAIITICGVFAASQLYIAARKQFSWKKLAVSSVTALGCIGIVLAVRIQTPEEYYRRNIDDVQPDSLTVTMTVSCEAIADELDGDRIIIPETEFVLLEDDTAFTLLERVLAYNEIPFDYSGSGDTGVYVKGINDIYEMDYGEMSGWMYMVNGEFPDTGCSSYRLCDGDTVEWLYTRNIGHDIGAEEYSE